MRQRISGSTLHKQVIDVAAFEGEQVVARSSLDFQVIDDPKTFGILGPIVLSSSGSPKKHTET